MADACFRRDNARAGHESHAHSSPEQDQSPRCRVGDSVLEIRAGIGLQRGFEHNHDGAPGLFFELAHEGAAPVCGRPPVNTAWVVTWAQLAENVSSSLTKGMRVLVTGRLEQRSWETEQGDKRSVVEIVADEIGPSLRFATAEVHRVERSGPSDGGPAPRSEPVTTPAGGGYDDYGEEPF